MMRDSLELDLPAGLRAEAAAQRKALHGEEFAELWSTWRSRITGA
jgi:hypothetical protein